MPGFAAGDRYGLRVTVLLVALTAITGCNSLPRQRNAVLLRVIDGDSFLVSYEGSEEQVRAIGIDAPEGSAGAIALRRENKSAEQVAVEIEMGRLAAAYASSLLPPGTPVLLVFDPANASVNHRDRYGRLLAFLYAPDEDENTFINLQMVADGYAETLTRYPFDQEIKSRLVRAEKIARQTAAGVWGLHPEVFN